MYTRPLPLIACALLACHGNGEPVSPPPDDAVFDLSADMAAGMRVVSFPAEDPGPPLYARVTSIMNQVFVDAGLVAIPIYRDPACIPADTDLLEHLHLPGPAGPGAFGCTLLIEGSYIIEADAPLGTFPVRVVAKGPAQIWFVDWGDFQNATADGTLTMAELNGLDPLRGTASTFHEMLAPRLDRHHVVIASRGQLEDGRSFRFELNHLGDVTKSILIRID
ncbi:MAG TPA: hypothetical protein VFZ69_04980 [Longimicrobiales bacterium]